MNARIFNYDTQAIWEKDRTTKALFDAEVHIGNRIADACQKAMADAGSDGFVRPHVTAFQACPKDSIDYAVMEHADNILTAKGVFSWDDVGAWPALENHFDADADNNVIIGNAAGIDAKDNIIISDGRLTALIGVEGLVVVQAGDATLICPKDRAQDVKQMVTDLKLTKTPRGLFPTMYLFLHMQHIRTS